MIPLLLDAGLPRGAATDLRASGWDVVHVSDIGLGSATDPEIMMAAERDSRVLVTLDNDFPRLVFLSAATRPSVLLFRISGLDRGTTVSWLHYVLPLVEADLLAGAVVSVAHDGARVRALR